MFDLIDKPYSSRTKLAVIAATAEALMTWEPCIELEKVTLRTFQSDQTTIDLTGCYLPDGRNVTVEGIEVS